jgi:indole-3-glycerol phosphate synthase
MAQRVLFGAFGSSIGTWPPWPSPTKTPGPILTDDLLKRFKAVADGIGIDCLIEVHDETELGRALDADADFIGINNRSLATFDVDLKVTERLAPKIPGNRLIVSESGIRTTEDIRRVIGAGAHGALIGESLMRASDPHALLEAFLAIAQETPTRKISIA